jgi:hypothetical protein
LVVFFPGRWLLYYAVVLELCWPLGITCTVVPYMCLLIKLWCSKKKVLHICEFQYYILRYYFYRPKEHNTNNVSICHLKWK